MAAATLTLRQRRAFAALRVDRIIVEAIDALARAGAEPILLKGPVIAGWLYDAPGDRLYDDCDLLVAPTALHTSEQALRAIGYEPEQVGRLGASQAWRRGHDFVDLHTTLIGLGVADAQAWAVLSAHTTTVPLATSQRVRALDETARTLHLATHVAQHERAVDKPRRDLELGLSVIAHETWVGAAILAHTLDAEAAFAAGLRRVDGGPALLATLDVAPRTMPMLSLLESGAPPTALGIAQLAALRSPRKVMGAIVHGLVPPPRYVRRAWPMARRGRPGLAVAHLQRRVHLARHLPSGVSAWRGARRG